MFISQHDRQRVARGRTAIVHHRMASEKRFNGRFVVRFYFVLVSLGLRHPPQPHNGFLLPRYLQTENYRTEKQIEGKETITPESDAPRFDYHHLLCGVLVSVLDHANFPDFHSAREMQKHIGARRFRSRWLPCILQLVNQPLHLRVSEFRSFQINLTLIFISFLSDNFKRSFQKACSCTANNDLNFKLQTDNSFFMSRFSRNRNSGKRFVSMVTKLNRIDKSTGNELANVSTGLVDQETKDTDCDSPCNRRKILQTDL